MIEPSVYVYPESWESTPNEEIKRIQHLIVSATSLLSALDPLGGVQIRALITQYEVEINRLSKLCV